MYAFLLSFKPIICVWDVWPCMSSSTLTIMHVVEMEWYSVYAAYSDPLTLFRFTSFNMWNENEKKKKSSHHDHGADSMYLSPELGLSLFGIIGTYIIHDR